ncbi:hypothetical protein HYS31_06075 [Candidatus Woesearchaeota archaeon]|nr:hypothetical protein [Candidatus Woesearchaeota archaeon]
MEIKNILLILIAIVVILFLVGCRTYVEPPKNITKDVDSRGNKIEDKIYASLKRENQPSWVDNGDGTWNLMIQCYYEINTTQCRDRLQTYGEVKERIGINLFVVRANKDKIRSIAEDDYVLAIETQLGPAKPTESELIDLSNYPDFFINNESIPTRIVIPNDEKEIEFLISANDIISVFTPVEPHQVTPIIKRNYASLLNMKTIEDSEISNLSSANLISLGNSCKNKITREILENKESCLEGEIEGRGRIILTTKYGRIHVVVTGYSTKDMQKAAIVLTEYGAFSSSYDLSGYEVHVFGPNIKELDISRIR